MIHSLLILPVACLFMASCAQKKKLPPDILELEALSSFVLNDDVQKAEVIIELVRIMTKKGFEDSTDPLISQITDYHSALARIAVWEELAKQGEFELVDSELQKHSNICRSGVGLQEMEIIVKMLSLADAVGGVESLKKRWESEKIEIPPYISANVLPNFTRDGGKPSSRAVLSQTNQSSTSSTVGSDQKVQERMVWRGTSHGLAIKVQGLIAKKKANEARTLLLPFFESGKELPSSSLSQTAGLLLLAYQSGLNEEVRSRLPQLIEESAIIPAGWIPSFRDFSSLITLLGELGVKEQVPSLVTKCLKKQTGNIEPYFLMLGTAQLAEGCWLAGENELALRLWMEAFAMAVKTPNPRSQVVGVFEVWAGMQRADAVIPEDLRAKTTQWFSTLEKAYADLKL
jgi:hypothetical protein